jgi:hypothetical protein
MHVGILQIHAYKYGNLHFSNHARLVLSRCAFSFKRKDENTLDIGSGYINDRSVYN